MTSRRKCEVMSQGVVCIDLQKNLLRKGDTFSFVASLGSLNCIWTAIIVAELDIHIYKLSFFSKIRPLLRDVTKSLRWWNCGRSVFQDGGHILVLHSCTN